MACQLPSGISRHSTLIIHDDASTRAIEICMETYPKEAISALLLLCLVVCRDWTLEWGVLARDSGSV